MDEVMNSGAALVGALVGGLAALTQVRKVVRAELEGTLAPLIGRVLRLETDVATLERKLGKVLDA